MSGRRSMTIWQCSERRLEASRIPRPSTGGRQQPELSAQDVPRQRAADRIPAAPSNSGAGEQLGGGGRGGALPDTFAFGAGLQSRCTLGHDRPEGNLNAI